MHICARYIYIYIYKAGRFEIFMYVYMYVCIYVCMTCMYVCTYKYT